MADAGCEGGCLDEASPYGGSANALDHRRERPLGEPLDKVGPARIDVDHARRDTDLVESRLDQQRVDLPADQRVATRFALQLAKTIDRRLGGGAERMVVGRSSIAFG